MNDWTLIQLRTVQVWEEVPLRRVLNAATGTVHLANPGLNVFSPALCGYRGTGGSPLWGTKAEPTCLACQKQAKRDWLRNARHLPPSKRSGGFSIVMGL